MDQRSSCVIDLNITLWFQLVNFLITLVVLNYLLVAPIRKIIRERKQKVEGLSGAIDSFVEESQNLLEGYEAELAKARADANSHRKAAKAEAEAAERSILAAAGKDAQASLQATQAAVRAEAESAHKALQTEMKTFADAALAKILG